MKIYKAIAPILILIAIIYTIVIFKAIKWYNTGEFAWTYLKYNNKLYVLCRPAADLKELNEVTLTKAGTVKLKIPIIFKPRFNNVSNGLPNGTEIYTSGKPDEFEVTIKFKGKYYPMENTANDSQWGNGRAVRLY